MEILSELKELKAGQAKLEAGQKRIEARIEDEILEKIRALYDFREVQQEINRELLSAIYRIEQKLDNLALHITRHETQFHHLKVK